MKKLIAHLVWDDQGQDLIEYVLIGSVVSIGALARRTGARHGDSTVGTTGSPTWVDGQGPGAAQLV